MIKTASLEDLKSVVSLACALWPAHTAFEMQDEIQKLLVDQSAAIALCIHGDRPIGFAQCQLRNDYVEGTESSPVGYLEGIYVEPAYRRAGVARRLLQHCEAWAKANNCIEFASDCELGNAESYQFHIKTGFAEENRIICFSKRLDGSGKSNDGS